MSDTPYQSGEFSPSSSSGHATDGGTAQLVGNTVYYAVPHSNYDLKIHQLDTGGLKEGNPDSVKSSNNWQLQSLSALVPNKNGATMETPCRPASVVYQGSYYLFWVDRNNNQLYVAVMSGGSWSPSAIPLKYTREGYPGGSNLNGMRSTPSAYAIQEGIVLSWTAATPSQLIHNSVWLDPATLNTTTNQWIGSELTQVDLVALGLTPNESYHKAQANWYAVGQDSDTGSELWSFTSVYSTDEQKMQNILLPLDKRGLPDTAKIDGNTYTFLGTEDASKTVDVVRDPAGRMMLVYALKDHDKLAFRYFNTALGGGTQPVLGEEQKFGDNNFSDKGVGKGITGVFLTSNTYQGRYNDSTGATGDRNRPAYQQTVYMMLCYASGDESSNGSKKVRFQVSQWGLNSQIPNYKQYQPENTDVAAMSVIMDSFPVPKQNIGPTGSNNSIIEVTYGVENSQSTSRKIDTKLMFGIRASEQVTVEGVSESAEASFKAGVGFYYEEQEDVRNQSGFSVESVVIDNQGTPDIDPYGEVYGTTMYELSETSSFFQDLGEALISGLAAPLMSQVTPVPGNRTRRKSSQYGTFAYTPGEIETYTEDSINQTMRDLYNNLSDTDKEKLDPGYATNYVQNIIIPQAQVLSGSDLFGNARRFLEFTVDSSGVSSDNFKAIQNTFTEASVNLETQAYAGVGVDVDASIFGKVEASVQVGFEMSMSAALGFGESQTWGVDTKFQTPFSFGVPGAKRYNVRMYIMKPNAWWAQELELFSGSDALLRAAGFDATLGKPLKLFYIVSDIEPADQ